MRAAGVGIEMEGSEQVHGLLCLYYCRFNYLLTGDEALDTHCPWYCLKCTDIMEEKEEEARLQQEGGGSSGRRTRNRR
jgi:hypothetical protein